MKPGLDPALDVESLARAYLNVVNALALDMNRDARQFWRAVAVEYGTLAPSATAAARAEVEPDLPHSGHAHKHDPAICPDCARICWGPTKPWEEVKARLLDLDAESEGDLGAGRRPGGATMSESLRDFVKYIARQNPTSSKNADGHSGWGYPVVHDVVDRARAALEAAATEARDAGTLDVERLARALRVQGFYVEQFTLEPPSEYEEHLRNVSQAIADSYAAASSEGQADG